MLLSTMYKGIMTPGITHPSVLSANWHELKTGPSGFIEKNKKLKQHYSEKSRG